MICSQRGLQAALLLAVLPTQAYAQLDELDGLGLETEIAEIDTGLSVSGASRRRQTLEEVPAAVTVITAEDIRVNGWRSITDALAYVRGLYVSNDRNYSYLGVRGFSRPGDFNSRVLVLVNGHPMNEAAYLSSMLGREFGVDIDLVERIEVIRGPGSALYGSNALIAVINVVTLTAPDVRSLDGVGVRMGADGDSLGRIKGRARIDRAIGSARLMLGGSYEFLAGQRYDDAALELGRPTSGKSDRGQVATGFAAFTWGPLTVQGNLNLWDKNVPTASYEVTPEAGETSKDIRGFLEARLDMKPHERINVVARTSLDYSHYDGFYPYEEEDGGDFTDGSSAWWISAEAYVAANPVDWLRASAGGSLQRYLNLELWAAQPGWDYDYRQTWAFWAGAVFGDVEVDLPFKATLLAGLRYDQFGTFGARASPRAAVVFRPFSGSTFKVHYGEAFRAPNVYELFFDDYPTEEYGQKPNPNLRPEVLRNIEVQWEQSIASNRGMLSVGLFYYGADGLIDLAYDEDTESTQYQNLESATGRGGEIELSGTLPWKGIRGIVSYTFSHVVDDATGERLANSPLHLAQARLIIPVIRNQAHVTIGGKLIGDRPGFAGREGAPAAGTVDVSASFSDIAPGLDVSLGATNLLNQSWSIPGGAEHVQDQIAQDGRALWTRASYTF